MATEMNPIVTTTNDLDDNYKDDALEEIESRGVEGVSNDGHAKSVDEGAMVRIILFCSQASRRRRPSGSIWLRLCLCSAVQSSCSASTPPMPLASSMNSCRPPRTRDSLEACTRRPCARRRTQQILEVVFGGVGIGGFV